MNQIFILYRSCCFIGLIILIFFDSIHSFPYKLPCSDTMLPGNMMMGNQAILTNTRSVLVLRNGVPLTSGSSFVNGEILTVRISTIYTTTMNFKFQFKADNGATFTQPSSGSSTTIMCNNTRAYNLGDGTLGDVLIQMPSDPFKGIVSVWAAWAQGYGRVYITDFFTLSNLPSTIPPTFSPAYKSSAPSNTPSKAPLISKAPTTIVQQPVSNSRFTSTQSIQAYTLVLRRELVNGKSLITVNHTSPGPTLRVKLGQTLSVQVINLMGDDVGAMHWHGFDQRHTPFMDGPPGVTQCPINSIKDNTTTYVGSINKITSMNYQFQPDREGTFWYHGHYNEQYVDGQYGAIIVEDSATTTNAYATAGVSYSQETELMLADWYNAPAHSLLSNYLSAASGGNEPMPDAIVVNNAFSHTMEISVSRGTPIRVRCINAAALSMYRISVDGMPLTVIEVDGNPVKPQDFSEVTLDAAQRVSFVLDWSRLDSNMQSLSRVTFRVHAVPTMYRQYDFTDANAFGLFGSSTNTKFFTQYLGHFAFTGETSTPYYAPSYYAASDGPTTIYPKPLDSNLMEMQSLFPSKVPMKDLWFAYNITFQTGTDKVLRSYINGQTYTPPSILDRPTLFDYMSVAGGPLQEKATYAKNSQIIGDAVNPFVIPFNRTIDILIRNNDGAPHPIHLHGHNFWIVSSSAYRSMSSIKRDVVSIPAMGWAIIRFVSDNPGVWLIHCHIDWHMANGFMAQIIEAPSKLKNTISSVPSDHKAACPGYFSGTTKSPTTVTTSIPTAAPQTALVISGAGLSSSSAISSSIGSQDWSTYGFNQQRTGLNSNEITITSQSWSLLKRKWKFQTRGGIISQPVVALNYPMFNANAYYGQRRLGVTNNPNFQYVGCYGDNAKRAFERQIAKKVASVSDCYNLALANGYSVYGLQYGGQCWVSNNLAVATSYGLCGSCVGCGKPTCNCAKTKCTSGEDCGDSWANDIYTINTNPVQSSITPSLIPSFIPSRSPSLVPSYLPSLTPSVIPSVTPYSFPKSTIPSLTPSVIPSVTPYSFQTSTIPSLAPSVIPSVTPYSFQTSTIPSLTPSNIPTRFPIQSTSTFGVSNPPTKVPTVSPMSLANAVLGYQYIGCYGDNAKRAFEKQLAAKVASVRDCYNLALANGYSVYGLQYGGQCWVSNNLAVATSYGLCGSCVGCGKPTCNCAKTKCTSGENCGDGWANDIYIVKPIQASDPPSSSPTYSSLFPTYLPSVTPSVLPSLIPSVTPAISMTSANPSYMPSLIPTSLQTVLSMLPSTEPTYSPSLSPILAIQGDTQSILTPSVAPIVTPSNSSSFITLSITPSVTPIVTTTLTTKTDVPTCFPSLTPTYAPTVEPSLAPTINPSCIPTIEPSLIPTTEPSCIPTVEPSLAPTAPTLEPTNIPTIEPSNTPTTKPSFIPTIEPSCIPTVEPSLAPTAPTLEPTYMPTIEPSNTPTTKPSFIPTIEPSCIPTVEPSLAPTAPTLEPTYMPTIGPSCIPTSEPSCIPTSEPSCIPTVSTVEPTNIPTAKSTHFPSVEPSFEPSVIPTFDPTSVPTFQSSTLPTFEPSFVASVIPSLGPSFEPSFAPSENPTNFPSISTQLYNIGSLFGQSIQPTLFPSAAPSIVSFASQYVGCYGDNAKRAFEKQLAAKVASVRDCYNLALANGYSVYGLQYGGQCWVSNNLAVATSYGLCGSCVGCGKPTCNCAKTKCTSGENCGDGWANDIYIVKKNASPIVLDTGVTIPSTSPTVNPSNIPSAPSLAPSFLPSLSPSLKPTVTLSRPTSAPTVLPSTQPFTPQCSPTVVPSSIPTCNPTIKPTVQPIVSSSIVLNKNVAYIGDESGWFYAIDLDTGSLLWETFLGYTRITFCADLAGGNFSITGTPVFDRSINTVYVVGGAGSFNALSMSTGNILWKIPNFYDPQHLHNYGALLLYNNVVYVTMGAMCDLNGVYLGGVYSVDTITRTVKNYFAPYQGAKAGSYGGGIWGLGGLTLGDMSNAATSYIYTPTGNCMYTGAQDSNYCEKLIKLDLNLNVVGSIRIPLGTKPDNDLGSSITYFNSLTEGQTSGCKIPLVAGFRKDGLFTVARADTFTPTQFMQIGNPNGAGSIQQAAWDPTLNMLVVPQGSTAVATATTPAYTSSLLGFSLNATCGLNRVWTTPMQSMSSPTIIGAVGKRLALVTTGFGLYAVNVQTGVSLGNKNLLGSARNAPVVVNGVVLMGINGNSFTQRGLEAWS